MFKNRKEIFQNFAVLAFSLCLCLFIGELIIKNFFDFSEVTRLHFKGSSIRGRESFLKFQIILFYYMNLKNNTFNRLLSKKKGFLE